MAVIAAGDLGVELPEELGEHLLHGDARQRLRAGWGLHVILVVLHPVLQELHQSLHVHRGHVVAPTVAVVDRAVGVAEDERSGEVVVRRKQIEIEVVRPVDVE